MVINAAPARPLDSRLLMLVDILIVNEAELLAVTGHDRDRDRDANVTEELLLDSPLLDTIPAVVVTLGNRGCIARVGREIFSQKAFTVSTVDTAGAGDTFCGVLVSALARSFTWPDALRRASAAAALAVTKPGAQAGIPSLIEVDELLQTKLDN